jgi:1,4-dihydroxy-2-naphthoate polyprenyltransferase
LGVEVKHISKTSAWIQAMRLRTLPLSFSVIICGNAIALGMWKGECISGASGYSWTIIALTLLTTLLLQILSNFANDYGDAVKGADNDNRVGPDRAIQSGILSHREMKKGIIITSVLSLISGFLLLFETFGEFDWIFISFLFIGVLAIVAAIKYTVGKSAYGYTGFGDVFVFLFFGIVGVVGSFYLQYPTSISELLPALIFGVMMGSISTAVLNLNNMRDRENDITVGKLTFAARIGFKGSKIYHYILFAIFWLCFMILSLPQMSDNWENLLFFIPVLIIHILHIIKVIKTKEPVQYDPELKKIALSAFLFSIILFTTIYLDN